jgi:hypothetical protein
MAPPSRKHTGDFHREFLYNSRAQHLGILEGRLRRAHNVDLQTDVLHTYFTLAVMAGPASRPGDETELRRRLVSLATDMLDGKLTFHEGAFRISSLRRSIGGIDNDDPDFQTFIVIVSETDHLPLEAQRKLWSASALERLAPEFKRVEEWARGFAPDACRNLIQRFRIYDS